MLWAWSGLPSEIAAPEVRATKFFACTSIEGWTGGAAIHRAKIVGTAGAFLRSELLPTIWPVIPAFNLRAAMRWAEIIPLPESLGRRGLGALS